MQFIYQSDRWIHSVETMDIWGIIDVTRIHKLCFSWRLFSSELFAQILNWQKHRFNLITGSMCRMCLYITGQRKAVKTTSIKKMLSSFLAWKFRVWWFDVWFVCKNSTRIINYETQWRSKPIQLPFLSVCVGVRIYKASRESIKLFW